MIERFYKYVSPEPNTGCWLWIKKGDKDGYGSFWVNDFKKSIQAHRASYMIFKGIIPKGLLVCHSCDVTACVNPDHLFLGTAKDNVHDMYKKGRNRKLCGENNDNAKLSKENVLEIKKLLDNDVYQVHIAKAFNVSQPLISLIKTGKLWNMDH